MDCVAACQVVITVPLEHYVLNAVLFILAGVRYFWGPPVDMLRLGLFLILGFVVMGDLDYYYKWPLQMPTFGFSSRETISKLLLITAYIADLGREYISLRFSHRLKDLTNLVTGKPEGK